ncbi:hypothetical protein WJX75_008506 [Coccomyxa subellipsoidea]|uniref:NYN domain-containing protein n=1 Tax=Coccomyxa subellipsoidea TaxID=248742 RepID=A0ABR2YFL1_9CHLO
MAMEGITERKSHIELFPCIVFWDLDNVRPKKTDDIEHLCTRLKAVTAFALGKLTGSVLTAADVFILAYCNQITLRNCRPQLAALKAMPDTLIMPVSTYRQSADMAIIAEMTAVANERDPPVAMALVSCDEGFAGTLRYCCGRGCATLCIGRARRRPGTAEVSEREMAQWRRQPLPAAAKLAICWEHIASLGM